MRDLKRISLIFNLEPELIQSVISVESGGKGFNLDGTIRILFEGHVFYKELKKAGEDYATIAKYNPTLCYKSWTKQYYAPTQQKEHQRLDLASVLNKECALKATSWGLFQIMGFNHKLAGYDTVELMVNAFKLSEENQIIGGLNFMKFAGLLDSLREKRFDLFACGYNGAKYAENQYDIKLKKAYEFAKINKG